MQGESFAGKASRGLTLCVCCAAVAMLVAEFQMTLSPEVRSSLTKQRVVSQHADCASVLAQTAISSAGILLCLLTLRTCCVSAKDVRNEQSALC